VQVQPPSLQSHSMALPGCEGRQTVHACCSRDASCDRVRRLRFCMHVQQISSFYVSTCWGIMAVQPCTTCAGCHHLLRASLHSTQVGAVNTCKGLPTSKANLRASVCATHPLQYLLCPQLSLIIIHVICNRAMTALDHVSGHLASCKCGGLGVFCTSRLA